MGAEDSNLGEADRAVHGCFVLGHGRLTRGEPSERAVEMVLATKSAAVE